MLFYALLYSIYIRLLLEYNIRLFLDLSDRASFIHSISRGMIAVTSFDNFLRVYDDRSGALLHSCENAEGGHFVSMCIDEINDQVPWAPST